MRNPFHTDNPFRRLAPRMGRIALSLAALVLVAQTVVAVHGVVHLTRGDGDRCEIALFAPTLSGCAPVMAPTPDLPPAVAARVPDARPVLRASTPLHEHPVRGPPAAV